MAWTWIKKPINKAILIGSIVLFAGALTTLIIGVTTHEEEGLLQVCWNGNKAVYVTEQDPCLNPEDVLWNKSQVPITVSGYRPDGDVLYPDSIAYREIAGAIRHANNLAEFELFRHTDCLGDISLIWSVAYETEDSWDGEGFCRHHRNTGEMRATAGIRDTSSLHIARRILLHELFHAAGLAHDDFPDSIMFPITGDDTNRDRVQWDRLTDHDKELLQTMYR